MSRKRSRLDQALLGGDLPIEESEELPADPASPLDDAAPFGLPPDTKDEPVHAQRDANAHPPASPPAPTPLGDLTTAPGPGDLEFAAAWCTPDQWDAVNAAAFGAAHELAVIRASTPGAPTPLEQLAALRQHAAALVARDSGHFVHQALLSNLRPMHIPHETTRIWASQLNLLFQGVPPELLPTLNDIANLQKYMGRIGRGIVASKRIVFLAHFCALIKDGACKLPKGVDGSQPLSDGVMLGDAASAFDNPGLTLGNYRKRPHKAADGWL